MKTKSNRSTKKRHFQHVSRRLKDMEEHRFLKMDCSGEFTAVGEAEDLWTPEELEAIRPRIPGLATDPARGTKISEGGLEEASVALTAENREVFDELERENTGSSEFIDEHGVEWDVKSPLSPPPHQNWEFSAEHQLKKVRKDFAQGDKVLFNLTRLNPNDLRETLDLFTAELNCEERDNLLVLADIVPEALPKDRD